MQLPRPRRRHVAPALGVVALLGSTAGGMAATAAPTPPAPTPTAPATAPAPAPAPTTTATATAMGATPTATSAPTQAVSTSASASAPKAGRYVGKVEVVRVAGAKPKATAGKPVITGTVFDDGRKDSSFGRGDGGVAGVLVSNGRDVVRTDEQGRYTLPAFDNMTVSITQPVGYQVPVDEHNIAQFHYNHLPAGSPKLRFGGIAPTGPVPTALNFPLMQSAATKKTDQECVIAGDLQTYSRREIGFSRDGALKDLRDRGPLDACGALFIGDVAGDDLGLYPHMKKALEVVDGPLRFLPGNHDLDLDATTAEHSFDTFRANVAPEYYSYDVGRVHVVALNTVRYPCTPEVDNADGTHTNCLDPKKPAYNGRLSDNELAWLKNDLANTPKDRLVVLASHIPFLTYADMDSTTHQLDQVKEVYRLVGNRPAVHVSGHTHSLENLKKGDSYGPWKEKTGVDKLPFAHIVSGAISGDWYSGDLDENGLPMAYQRDGARPGLLTLDVTGNTFKERFDVTGEEHTAQMGLGVNSPHWRNWFTTLDEWRKKNPNTSERVTPPLNANDLGDPNMVTTKDLAGGTWLTTNFWMGATDSKVSVSIDGGAPQAAKRTQPAKGEDQLVGAEYADPKAATRQLAVMRTAAESTSGDEDAQGYRLYRGNQYGPGPGRPGNNLADRMHHLWKLDLPKNLAEGTHHAKVTATDSYGRTYTESIAFTVVDERPRMEFRTDLFPTN